MSPACPLRRRLEGIAKLPVRPDIHAVVTVGDDRIRTIWRT
jgi:hypothetical protein